MVLYLLVETGECISGPCQGQALEKVSINVHSDGGILPHRRITFGTSPCPHLSQTAT